MKNITILLLFISFAFSLSAQRSEKSQFKQHFLSQGEIPKGLFPKETSMLSGGKSLDRKTMVGLNKSLKRADDLKQRLDSIVYQNYDTITFKWKPNSKDVFIFNDNESPHQYKKYDWNPDTKEYKEVYEEDFAYNSDGDITSYIEQTNMDGMMVNSYRETYEYDELGRPKTYTEYNWDKNKSEWVESYREEYSYDSFGRDSTYTEYLYDTDTRKWEPDYKEEYYYNSNFGLETYIGYNWNSDSEKWDKHSMGTYSYLNNGLPETITLNLWNASNWENYSQEKYTYNAAGQVLTIIYIYWQLTQWVNFYKFNYAYNSYGLILLQSLLSWNVSDWQNNYKIEYGYNEDKLSSIIYSYWNVATLAWIYYYRQIYTLNLLYTYVNLIIPPWFSETYYRYMVLNYVYSLWIANNWVYFENSIYYYSSLNATSVSDIKQKSISDLLVYPNPTSGFINFEWEGNYEGMNVKFYDAHGNLVLYKKINNHSQFNIEKLNKGIYFYKLEYNNQTMDTGKITVE